LPYRGYFAVQIVLGQADHERAREAELGASTREIIAAAHAYHDGRWLSLAVKTIKDLEDVYTLLRVKRKPAKRR
jgi:hypothetical protein